MALSIPHRVTGDRPVGRPAALDLVAAGAGRAARTPSPPSRRRWTTSSAGLVLFGFTASLFFHLCNGIRHLAWDAGYGFDKQRGAADRYRGPGADRRAHRAHLARHPDRRLSEDDHAQSRQVGSGAGQARGSTRRASGTGSCSGITAIAEAPAGALVRVHRRIACRAPTYATCAAGSPRRSTPPDAAAGPHDFWHARLGLQVIDRGLRPSRGRQVALLIATRPRHAPWSSPASSPSSRSRSGS